jgi:hypothetical protein
MLGEGLEEMRHKVPLTFSNMAPKKISMYVVNGDCTGCLKSQSLMCKILFFCGTWADDHDESKVIR